jgi:hypothetical protein
VAIYVRYSTDQQNARSIEDQIRVCQERSEREGWTIYDCYSDYALSGATIAREGLQQMLQDGREGKLDIILVESKMRRMIRACVLAAQIVLKPSADRSQLLVDVKGGRPQPRSRKKMTRQPPVELKAAEGTHTRATYFGLDARYRSQQ